MKKTGKIIGLIFASAMLLQAFAMTAFAENVNTFPPQRPQVGTMKAAGKHALVTVGLRENGTINVAGSYDVISSNFKNELHALTNIVDVAYAAGNVVALRSDGTVYVGTKENDSRYIFNRQDFSEAKSWTDIVSIKCGWSHLVGLKADGTVVATGEGAAGQCNTYGWSNVSKIYADGNATFGIRADGTVMGAGEIKNYNDIRGLSNVVDIFSDIANMGTTANYYVLKNDGTTNFIVDNVPTLNGAYCDLDKLTDYDEQKNVERKSMTLDELWAITGIGTKIVDVGNFATVGGEYCYILDDNKDLYAIIHDSWRKMRIEKIVGNIEVFEMGIGSSGINNNRGYYAIDSNGRIFSQDVSYDSASWYLSDRAKNTSNAQGINVFPPQRPEVGNMMIVGGGKTSYGAGTEGCDVIGLRTNGTVNANVHFLNEYNAFSQMKNEVLCSVDVVDVAYASDAVALLKSDGSVYVAESYYNIPMHPDESYHIRDAASWSDIVNIEAGNNHIVGLKSDGTVVAAGDETFAQCSTGWDNISKIYAKENATIGIKADGTVVAVGDISNYADLSKQKNVVDVFKGSIDDFYTIDKDGNTSYIVDDVSILNGKITDPANLTEEQMRERSLVSMPLSDVWELLGTGTKIKKVVSIGTSKVIIIDSNNDLYEVDDVNTWSSAGGRVPTAKKITGNIVYADSSNNNGYGYYAVDHNGQIWSDMTQLTSDDWVLTTNIVYNGEKINSDVAPYVKDGRTLAPIRAILEALGMTVTWDQATQTATAVSGNVTISVSIGNNVAKVNGADNILDVPAEITNGRTFVPVRFFAEALNLKVDWDGYTKTVSITK